MNGARGYRDIKQADVIFVHLDRPGRYQRPIHIPTISEGPAALIRLDQIYDEYAARTRPDLDPSRNIRKCIVQARWVERCLEEGRRLEGGDKGGYEMRCVRHSKLAALRWGC